MERGLIGLVEQQRCQNERCDADERRNTSTPSSRRGRITGTGLRGNCIVVATSDQGLDLDARVGCRLQPAPGILLEAAVEQPSQAGMQGCRQLAPVGLRFEYRRQCLGRGLSPERPLSGEHLEEHDTERPDVGALVDGVPARLLRTHVGGGAHDEA